MGWANQVPHSRIRIIHRQNCILYTDSTDLKLTIIDFTLECVAAVENGRGGLEHSLETDLTIVKTQQPAKLVPVV